MTSTLKFRDLLAQRPLGAWVILSDACVDPRTGAVGLGGALFNATGDLVSTWSERSTRTTRDTTVAELLALDLAARRAQKAGVTHLFAIADCQPSVQALNGNDMACSKAMDLVQQVRSTFNAFTEWGCGWSPRHRLSVPNDLARAGIGKPPENRQAITGQNLNAWMGRTAQPYVVEKQIALEQDILHQELDAHSLNRSTVKLNRR